MRLTLSRDDFLRGIRIGMHRNLRHIDRGSRSNYGLQSAGWSEHIEGACGEIAAAQALGIDGRQWIGRIGADGEKEDLPYGLHVRTRSGRDWNLYVSPREAKTNGRFVLVRGIAPEFDIAGWFIASEARRKDWLGKLNKTRSGNEAYIVPNDYLRPIVALIAILEKERVSA